MKVRIACLLLVLLVCTLAFTPFRPTARTAYALQRDFRCVAVICTSPSDPPDQAAGPIDGIESDLDYRTALQSRPEWFQMPDFMRELPNYMQAPVMLYKQVKRVACDSDDAKQLQIQCDPRTEQLRIVSLQISMGPLIHWVLPGSWDDRSPGDDDKAEAKKKIRAIVRKVVYVTVATVGGSSYAAYRINKVLADHKISLQCEESFTERCRQAVEERYFDDPDLIKAYANGYEMDLKEELAFTNAMMSQGYTVLSLQIGGRDVRKNKVMHATLDVPPYINGGRTFVPLRFLSEQIGAKVEAEKLPDGRWKGTAYLGSNTLIFEEGQTYILKNGAAISTCAEGACAQIENRDGRLSVPLRFVARALDAEVMWLSDARKVLVARR